MENPARCLALFCWILGISIEPCFVRIEESQIVAVLKEEIVKKISGKLPPDINSENFDIWKVCGFSPP
jgi:Crinkler effector protein N-terminal domain